MTGIIKVIIIIRAVNVTCQFGPTPDLYIILQLHIVTDKHDAGRQLCEASYRMQSYAPKIQDTGARNSFLSYIYIIW